MIITSNEQSIELRYQEVVILKYLIKQDDLVALWQISKECNYKDDLVKECLRVLICYGLVISVFSNIYKRNYYKFNHAIDIEFNEYSY